MGKSDIDISKILSIELLSVKMKKRRMKSIYYDIMTRGAANGRTSCEND